MAIWYGRVGSDGVLSLLTSAIRSPLRETPHGLLRLSASLMELFPAQPVNFKHPIFRDLTHLELLDFPRGCERWSEQNNIGCLSNLRYLFITYFNSRLILHIGDHLPLGFLRRFLKECASLDILVLPVEDRYGVYYADVLSKDFRWTVDSMGALQMVAEDRVALYERPFPPGDGWSEYWYRGAAGGEDIWVHSEKVVQRRRWKRESKNSLWESMVDCDEDVSLG
ncbi:hypothetical protein AX16_006022 [Volvariella volvacea WC 439]|nr:hypothetical protein AX16_006022 [Volvariella volvacea WC 439]